MRTLFVTVDPAWPPISGADLRNWQNAVGARGLGSATLVSLVAAQSRPDGDIDCRSLSEATSDEAWPRLIDAGPPPEAASRFAAMIEDVRPDTIVFENLHLHPLLPIARRGGARVIFDLHNIDSAVAMRAARKHLPLRPFRWRSSAKHAEACAELESRVLAEADAAWVCSIDEATALSRIARDVPVHVVPNGIPRPECAPGALQPNPKRRNGRFTLIFAGHLSYPPNIEATRWLATRILPALRRRCPDAVLVLAGRNPAPEIAALASHPMISLHANPDDLDGLLAAADLAVLPLRSGGGTRIKAVEAMSRGLPMVATRLAVAGLGLAEGVHYLAAETTGAFARVIAALAADSASYASLRGAAWRHCLQHYSPGAIARAVQRGLAGP